MMFNQCPKYGMTSVGGRRRDMEDAVAIHPSFCPRDSLFPSGLHFFGVYDGHGCSHPDRPDELNRIQEAGGRVIYWDGARVLGVLAMSRAIGDSYLKPYMVSEPEVTITERTEEDECLILASDGLWDVVSNDTACSIARMCIDGQAPSPPPLPRSGSRSSGGDDDMNVGVAGETSDKSNSLNRTNANVRLDSKTCYGLRYHADYTPNEGTSLRFGGPGGGKCD
ncbi:hypothetical protein NE237_022949 [Protea cynaroides]|uniref:protein-serine/threonine phosphatase n=1 Tax=Protea cynaroides TaxID=273540 RepID=A0A9Q0HE59_9MAGN|nr:hypothetical protein NE237_022949 [Protea cynaroides]